MATQKIRQGQVGVSAFEDLLQTYGLGTVIMVDSQTGGHTSQPAVQTSMITGHPRPPAAFDGQYDRIHIPDDASLDGSTFSVVVVFQTVNNVRNIVSRWNTNNGHLCWSMDTSAAGTNKLRFYVADTSATSTIAATTSSAPTDGSKHIAVGTFDGSKIVRLYLDTDAAIVSSAMSGTPRNTAATANITIGGTRPSDVIENNQGDAFMGNIGAFAHGSGVVLSGAQVAALHALL